MNKTHVVFVIISLLTSCDFIVRNHHEKEIRVIPGGMVVERFFNDSLLLDSTETFYYENSKIHSITTYKNGLKNGNYLYYYKSGNVATIGEFIDNNREGKWINYFDGKGKRIKEAKIYQKGNIVGGAYSYDSLGNIETYYLYDLKGRLRYRKDMKNCKEEGEVFPAGFVDNNSFERNRSNTIYLVVGSPPASNVDVSIFLNKKQLSVNKGSYSTYFCNFTPTITDSVFYVKVAIYDSICFLNHSIKDSVVFQIGNVSD